MVIKSIFGLIDYVAILDELKTETPIFNVDGITVEDVSELLNTGVLGLAVSAYVTHNFDRIRTFNQLLKVSSNEEQCYAFK